MFVAIASLLGVNTDTVITAEMSLLIHHLVQVHCSPKLSRISTAVVGKEPGVCAERIVTGGVGVGEDRVVNQIYYVPLI